MSLGDLCFGEFVDLLRPKCATVAVLENRSSNRSDVELWVEVGADRLLHLFVYASCFVVLLYLLLLKVTVSIAHDMT